MKRLITGIRCGVMLALMLLVTSCASTMYVATRCDKEKKNEVIPVCNATSIDIVFIRETWEEWPGNDYILPPWLDSSLNVCCGVIDIPISIVFDTATLPFQGIDYYIRREKIIQTKKSNKTKEAIASPAAEQAQPHRPLGFHKD